jgi:hypothetical protein
VICMDMDRGTPEHRVESSRTSRIERTSFNHKILHLSLSQLAAEEGERKTTMLDNCSKLIVRGIGLNVEGKIRV